MGIIGNKGELKMLDKMEVYYFSPTGGTKKVSSIFADAMEKEVIWHDLGSKEPTMEKPEGEMTVVASPVFGGRIPSVVREKIEKFSGTGKKAVTIAVYGNRAYEDALLEMNDILTKCGFTVIASGAFVAQHSMAPEVGAGRPDGEDEKEIHKFAETVKNSTAPSATEIAFVGQTVTHFPHFVQDGREIGATGKFISGLYRRFPGT